MPKAIARLNSFFSPRRLSKLSRKKEPLPTEQKQLSSYRTRLGTMLEYGLSTEIEKILYELYGDNLYLTFAVAHEYPDFYLRNKKREQVLKIEMKAVDAASDEQAARFGVLSADIDPNRDFILFVGWSWEKTKDASGEWEFPKIFAYEFLSAIEIAKERDRRLYEIGGKIKKRQVLVPSTKNPGKFVNDPGNFGKFWRIVTSKRRASSRLRPDVNAFVQFLTKVDRLSPRKRMTSKKK